MKNSLVSIIVPIYNVEKYLEKCIDSIINQTYNNIEIILVNDGSTDNCLEICKKYKLLDDRIIIINKENGGLSDARNFGIQKSNGEYIMFIDSDDWVDTEYVNTFYNIITSSNADLAIGGIQAVISNDCNKSNEYSSKVITKEEAYKEMFLGNGSIISACAKMYKKNIFVNCFFDKGKLYEDFLLFDKIIEKSRIIVKSNYNGYYYYIRDNSIMRSNYSDKRMILIEKSKFYIEFAKAKYPTLEKAAIRRYVFSCFGVLYTSIMDSKNDDISKKIRKLIIANNKYIFKCSEFNKKDKIQTLLINMGIKPYRLAMKIYTYLKYRLRK